MVKARLFAVLVGVAGSLPLPVLRGIGNALGWLLWLTNTRMAQVSRSNIALCYPELSRESQRILARSSVIETGKTICETLFAWQASHDRCLAAIDDVAGEHLLNSTADGTGLLIVMPHLGNWEMLNHYLGEMTGLTHMYLPYRHPAVSARIHHYREKSGTRFVAADTGGIRRQLSELQHGRVIGMMPDQEPDINSGEFRPYFDTEALTGLLPARMVQSTGCRVLLADCVRSGSGFKVTVSAVNLEDGEDISSQLNLVMARRIAELPAHYLWSYKRFRTRPEGEPEIYGTTQGRFRRLVDNIVLTAFFRCLSWIGRQKQRELAELISPLLGLVTKYRRDAEVNVSLCLPEIPAAQHRQLVRASLTELATAAFESGSAWHRDTAWAESCFQQVDGLEYLTGAAVILTPPLGNRELLFRFLGDRFAVVEYYHPNSNESLDRKIRHARSRMGVALVPHTSDGESSLRDFLDKGRIATICPDQQPRLAGGEFVDFFGEPALTTRALPRLLRERPVPLVFGVALRDSDGYGLHFHPCEYAVNCTDAEILQHMNDQLEAIVRRHPDQYRWSDKRFNIRPRGLPKHYR